MFYGIYGNDLRCFFKRIDYSPIADTEFTHAFKIAFKGNRNYGVDMLREPVNFIGYVLGYGFVKT